MKSVVDPNLPPALGKRIVVVGGGFAGIEFAKKISTKYYQVVLLDKNNYHQFQPLFYQVATAGIEPSAISYPFRKLFQNRKNLHFRMAEVMSVDTSRKALNTSIGEIKYDYLVLALGATTNFYGNEELQKNAFKLKSTSDALTFRNSILRKFELALLAPTKEKRKELLQFVIVGGGPTGVEVCGALSEMKKFILPKDYPEIDFDLMNIYLIEGSDRVLSAMSPSSSNTAEKYLENFGIHVIKNKTVKSYDGTTVTLSDESTLNTKTLVWAAGVKAVSIPGIDPSVLLPNKRIKVDEYNRVKGYNDVFVLGDLAANDQPLPQVAQVAIQQGKRLAKNLNKAGDIRKWKPFTYHDMGTMATVGRNKAVAEIYGLKFQGFPAWFVWMFIHLISILGVKNRLQTFINWAWNYFSYDQSLRLMINTYKEHSGDIPAPVKNNIPEKNTEMV
jgi:NADH dehydrogenase